MGFSREMVEFGWNRGSLKELRDEVQSTENQIERMRKSNARLTKDLNSGGFAKYASRLRDVKRELMSVRAEEEKLQRLATRQRMVGQYGRIGGNAAYYTGRAVQTATPAMSGAARSALGLAGSVGAPLALGAMVSRGLSGTAAAAKLDMEFEKLSRSIANDLMPVISTFTRFLGRINRAKENVRNGNATEADKGLAFAGNGRTIAGLAGVAGASALGYSPLKWAGRGVGAAGAFAMKNPLLVAGGYMINRGMRLGDMDDRITELSKATTTSVRRGSGQIAGPRVHEKQFTAGEFDKVKDLVGQYNMQDPSKRAEWLKNALAANKRIVSDLENKYDPSKPFSFVRGLVGSTVGDYSERRHGLLLKRRALERLQTEAGGGAMFSDGSNLESGAGRFNPLMMQVAGAGERRDSTGLHQELAERIAQTMQGAGPEDPTTLDDIADLIGEGLAKISDFIDWIKRNLPFS